MTIAHRGFGFPDLNAAKAFAARSAGGKARVANKTGHQWTLEEARAAGKLGGAKSRGGGRRKVSG